MSNTDTIRLDWAEQNPEKFLALVVGKCPEDDGLRVYSKPTGNKLEGGAVEFGSARWDMRAAIDDAIKTQQVEGVK